MPARKKGGRKTRNAQPRASITFPPELYRTLEDLAKQNKVSIAWVVRDAVDKYVADKWPLFSKKEGTQSRE
jgi:predicted DNA-binding protein